MVDTEQKKQKLLIRNQEHCQYSNYWELLQAMVEGGSHLKPYHRAELFTSAFHRNKEIIANRLRMSRYSNVMGGLVAIVRSQVMATATNYQTTSTDPFWMETFLKQGFIVEGKKVDINEFISYSVACALAQEKVFSVVEVTEEGLPFVALYKRPSMVDWDKNRTRLGFAKLLSVHTDKKNWYDELKVVYRYVIYQYDEEQEKYYGSVYELSKELEDAEKGYHIPDYPEDLSEYDLEIIIEDQEMYNLTQGGVTIAPSPVISLNFESPLWLADALYEAQKTLFNQVTATEWALLSTNFAQLVFNNVPDPEIIRERFIQAGDGYYLPLPIDVSAEWLERGTDGIRLGVEYSEKVKDEMYDQISVIAATNATEAMRRSGESKQEDRRNLEILLKTYGKKIRKYIEQILQTAMIAKGEKSEWTVSGFEVYNVDQFMKDLEEYVEAEKVIKSETFSLEGQKSVALKAAQAINIPKAKWLDIVEEIDSKDSYLSDAQLNVIKDLMISGIIPIMTGLQTLVEAQALPANFPLNQAMLELNGTNEPLDLSDPNEQEN